MKNELLSAGRREGLDAKDRAHKLFLHGIMSYVNGRIEISELCDRLIRVDSIIRGHSLDETLLKRKLKLDEKIKNRLGRKN